MPENFEDRNDIVNSHLICESLAGSLPDSTTNGIARRQALELLPERSWDNPDVVSYRSAGKLLIVDREQGEAEQYRAIAIANDLAGDTFNCTVLIDGIEPDSRDQTCRGLSSENITVVGGTLAEIDGFLGQFTARLEGKRFDINLAQLGATAGEYFDLVLDLNNPSYLQHEVLPPGYYAPCDDREALQSALEQIPYMTGEFSKPVFVKYQANICAHGSRGVTGCTRCLDVCPAEAILDKGEKVKVNTSLCQGCGSCIMNCPTGALSYTFPPVQQWLTMVRDILKAYRGAGGSHPDLLVYDYDSTGGLQAGAGKLPDTVIPVPVKEIGSTGADAWLSMLAYGARSVALLIGHGTPQSVVSGLQSRFSETHAMLEGMGYAKDRLRLMRQDKENSFLTCDAGSISGDEIPAAVFDPFEKQKTIRMAMDHLYRHAPLQQAAVPLPDGAAFGEIRVDHDTCTLCMSCVAACPVQALQQDSSQMRLEFIESDCVQCGLCRNTCPEDSITLVSRYIYDDAIAGKPRLLNEDEPFHCIACGKPFAGRRMLDRIAEKLAHSGNWSLEKEAPPEWLHMCGDCRIK